MDERELREEFRKLFWALEMPITETQFCDKAMALIASYTEKAELRGEYNGLQRALLAKPKGESPDFVTMMLTTCTYVTERLKEIEEILKEEPTHE